MESKKILRFDIETASEVYTETDWLNYPKRKSWEKKTLEKGLDPTLQGYIKGSGIYAEYAKVVCFSYSPYSSPYPNSLIGEDEKTLLLEVKKKLEGFNDSILGGFNIIGFDIPFLRKRMIINRIKPPKCLCIGFAKPRELPEKIVDVFKIRQHQSFSCNLDLLSGSLTGSTPKSNGSGDYVSDRFYNGGIEQIKKYCEGDVLATMECYKAIVDPEGYSAPIKTINNSNPQGQNGVNVGSTDPISREEAGPLPSQEGMINNPNKPVFSSGDLLKEKSKGKEIVEKRETAEFYIDALEHQYSISDELRSQLYSLYEREKKKYLPLNPGADDGFPF